MHPRQEASQNKYAKLSGAVALDVAPQPKPHALLRIPQHALFLLPLFRRGGEPRKIDEREDAMAYARKFMLREHKEAHLKNPAKVGRGCQRTHDFFVNRNSKIRDGVVKIKFADEQKMRTH